jgi:hypothetical protein
MFEAATAISLLLTGVSVVQTERALGAIEQHSAATAETTRQAMVEGGTVAGKMIRTLRYCKNDSRADAYHAVIVGKMAPYGEYGRLMISTMDQVANEPPDLSKAPKGFTCKSHAKQFDAAFAKLQ